MYAKLPADAALPAGEDVLSRAVNAAIGFKPLYGVMKEMARRAMQNSAEKSGVPWRQQVQELSETEEVGTHFPWRVLQRLTVVLQKQSATCVLQMPI